MEIIALQSKKISSYLFIVLCYVSFLFWCCEITKIHCHHQISSCILWKWIEDKGNKYNSTDKKMVFIVRFHPTYFLCCQEVSPMSVPIPNKFLGLTEDLLRTHYVGRRMITSRTHPDGIPKPSAKTLVKSCVRQSNIKSRKSAQKKRAFRLAIRIITCKFAPKKPKYPSNND